jgi:hypothetical protein
VLRDESKKSSLSSVDDIRPPLQYRKSENVVKWTYFVKIIIPNEIVSEFELVQEF